MVLALAQAVAAVPTPSSCPDANCVSNDMTINIVTVTTPANPTCDSEADTVQLEVTHTITPQGGNTRYDVGLYVANDGVGTTCLADVLESPQATGFFDDEGDVCGDINAEVTHTQTYTVPCTDEDNDNFLDPVLICQSWKNQAGQEEPPACTESTVIFGTAAHCNCLQVDTEVPIGGVPTMGQWALGLLSLLLVSVGVLFVRKGNLI